MFRFGRSLSRAAVAALARSPTKGNQASSTAARLRTFASGSSRPPANASGSFESAGSLTPWLVAAGLTGSFAIYQLIASSQRNKQSKDSTLASTPDAPSLVEAVEKDVEKAIDETINQSESETKPAENATEPETASGGNDAKSSGNEQAEPGHQETPSDASDATEGDGVATPSNELGAPYVIVGGGTAAYFALRGIHDKDPEAKVLIIGEEPYLPYARTPLSKELWFDERGDDDSLTYKDWSGRERSLFYRNADFYCSPDELLSKEGKAVAVMTGTKVVDLNVDARALLLQDGRVVRFSKCLLATGGVPKNLPVFEQADESVRSKITLYRKIDDFKSLKQLAEQGKTVAVVGGGFLGSELAAALAHVGSTKGGQVIQVFPEEGNMAVVFPRYLQHWTTNKMKEMGVHLHPHVTVTSAKSHDGQVVLGLSNNSEIKADHVLVAVGLEPNTELARRAGLEIDDTRGGIIVNSELEARSDVWAAGDVASFYDVSLGRRRVEHHDHAAVSGRLAGENMAGARRPYHHQSMFWSDLGPKIGYEAIGICDSSLKTVSVWAAAEEQDTPKAATASGNIRSGMDDSKPGEASESAHHSAASKPTSPEPASEHHSHTEPEFGKGVVFYMREKRVVGVLLWNVFGKIPVARKIIRDAQQYEDSTELTKLFNLHEADH